MSKYLVPYSDFSDLNKWREIVYSYIRKLYIVKIFPRFNTMQIKIPIGIFVQVDKLILGFLWEFKEP
jgi:hypothetical protein